MEWKKVKLGEVLNFRRGHDLPHEQMTGGDIPVAGSNGIIGYHNVASPIEPILTIGRSGNIGTPFIYERAWAHNTTLYVDDFKGNDPRFLYYLCKTLPFASFKGGSAVPTLNRNHIHPLEVQFPSSIDDQRRIASILSSLDAQIENNNRINANLEAQAQALFKSWFVDFEPWGGVMPEDWKEGKLGDIVQMLNGFAFKSDCFTEEGKYQLITIKGVQDGFLTTESAVKINDIPEKMPTWCLLEKGDILLSLTGNVGRCCYVDRDNLLLNQRVAKVQPLQEYNRMFVYAMFRTETMKSRMIGLARGTAQANLSPIETSNLEILIPSEDVLKNFGSKSNCILNQMINNTEANARLAALRDTLLPKLMKGEIEV